MNRKLAFAWAWLVMLMTNWLPDCPSSMRLRGWLLGFAMKKRGADFQVAGRARITGIENISVGNHVYLAPGATLLGCTEIELSDEVMVSYYSVIVTGNHTKVGRSFRFGAGKRSPVRIGFGTWVAANCTIVAGVTIGEGVLVAANSVVTSDVPDHVVIGGVPARVIGTDKCR